jgi:hypothetical protein
MEPTWRKPAGIIGLLLYLTLYAGLVAAFADVLALLPGWLMLLVYVVLGIAWIAPLRPLFLWMNTGRWTAPKADR